MERSGDFWRQILCTINSGIKLIQLSTEWDLKSYQYLVAIISILRPVMSHDKELWTKERPLYRFIPEPLQRMLFAGNETHTSFELLVR